GGAPYLAGQGGVGGGDGGGGTGATMGTAGAAGGPRAEVVSLVSGQDNVRQIVSDRNTLFWVSAGTAANNFFDGAVRACGVNGCQDNPRILAAEQPKPEYIGVADPNAGKLPGSDVWSNQIYWTTTLGGAVLRCAKTGCAQPSIVAEGQTLPTGVNVSSSASSMGTAAGDVHVYWATAGGAGGGAIKRCKLEDGPCVEPEVLASGLRAPSVLITGLTYLYWLTPASEAGGFADGELHRFRKNPLPAPDRPDELRLFAMSKSLHDPVSFDLQISNLYISTRGAAPGDEAAGIWVGHPTGNDGSDEQMEQFLFSTRVTATVATPKTLYWLSGGTLYGCPINGCSASGPVPLANNAGAGPMYVDDGPVDDFVYTVNERTITKIRVPLALTQLPP
ncbi:MAG TPA: hypothetical protein VFS00_16330, partial [Polyangiaceae bacterium]|nr:hypothetical protein [Polyangiaceae bacterium]